MSALEHAQPWDDDLLLRIRASAAKGARKVTSSAHDVEDAASEATVAFLRAVVQGKAPDRPLGWARAVGANIARRLRNNARRVRRLASEAWDVVADGRVDGPGGSPEAEVDGEADPLRMSLKKHRARLTPKQARTIELILQRLSHGAAARALGMAASNFRRVLRRAIKKLNSIQENGTPPGH